LFGQLTAVTKSVRTSASSKNKGATQIGIESTRLLKRWD